MTTAGTAENAGDRGRPCWTAINLGAVALRQRSTGRHRVVQLTSGEMGEHGGADHGHADRGGSRTPPSCGPA
jgi:hypothetical protein